MAESNNLPNNIYNENDTLDINELASLNDDITPEFIEKLQNQVSQTAHKFTEKSISEASDDAELFEEVKSQGKPSSAQNTSPNRINLDESIDDNFIKKYKARLNKQQAVEDNAKQETEAISQASPPEINQAQAVYSEPEVQKEQMPEQSKSVEAKIPDTKTQNIENLTGGNITEKPISQEQKSYNDSLDLLDNNVKYSKYVIYTSPENTEFIESLTVKERKNLINRIIREQDDIAITKRRLSTIQTIIKHTIVAIITIALSIPVIYTIINSSLEATINNHRRSQILFQTLYKEHGKIKTINMK